MGVEVIRVVLTVLTAIWAVVIPAFWWRWLKTPVVAADHPVGYESHERSFLLPDSVLTVLLAACALTVGITGTGWQLGLIAGGMMLFLGIIDFGYDLQQGAGTPDFMIDSVLTGSAIMIIALAWWGQS